MRARPPRTGRCYRLRCNGPRYAMAADVCLIDQTVILGIHCEAAMAAALPYNHSRRVAGTYFQIGSDDVRASGYTRCAKAFRWRTGSSHAVRALDVSTRGYGTQSRTGAANAVAEVIVKQTKLRLGSISLDTTQPKQ